MESGTILYYYPIKYSLNGKQGHSAAAKKHFWQEAKLPVFCAAANDVSGDMMSGRQAQGGDEEAGRIYACPVPVFYYRKREWKPQKLCKAMEEALYRTEGMTDTFLAPGMEKLLPEDMRGRWQPRMETIKRLTALQLAQRAKAQGGCPHRAVVRLGSMQDADWQMEMTWELLQPYLPKINQCVLWHNAPPDLDIREELSGFLEEYYYEYGLVVQTKKYGTGRNSASASPEQTDDSGLYLDFRRDNLYRSALKYLDTMVKNSYYK